MTMWLLNTKTKQLKDFQGEAPQYVILSHTWEQEEVLFADVDNPTSRTKQGWKKVDKCCEIAAAEGWEWVWIDTCCIDKESSAQLSEAINSMFRWYQDASICYTYLSDFPNRSGETIQFKESRWFTRGWTLQELIAPAYVVFFDQEWNDIGTRNSLSDPVQTATGVSARDILNFSKCSIARRMSWASQRSTTRVEDMAYCLMGVFAVNMPIIYGEGDNAFRRLQVEIMQISDDDSILAWHGRHSNGLQVESMQISDDDSILPWHGWHLGDSDKLVESCLARHPRCFAGSGEVNSTNRGGAYLSTSQTEYRGPRYSMTNIGVSIDVLCFDNRYQSSAIEWIAQLHCTYGEGRSPIALVLSQNGGRFSRYYDSLLAPFDASQHCIPKTLKGTRTRMTLMAEVPGMRRIGRPFSLESSLCFSLVLSPEMVVSTVYKFRDGSSTSPTSLPMGREGCYLFDDLYRTQILVILFVPCLQRRQGQDGHKVIVSVAWGNLATISLGLYRYAGNWKELAGINRQASIQRQVAHLKDNAISYLRQGQATVVARARPRPHHLHHNHSRGVPHVEISVTTEEHISLQQSPIASLNAAFSSASTRR